MYSVLPSIDSRISRIAPGFRALSISVEAAQIVDTGIASEALSDACRSLAEGGCCLGQGTLVGLGRGVPYFWRQTAAHSLFL